MGHSSMVTKRPVPEHELRSWGACLLDPNASLVERSRALWGLRHASELLAVELLSDFLCNVVETCPSANALLQHEAAYILGQRGNLEAIPCLVHVLKDSRHHPVVRHEAAEALAALCETPDAPVTEIEAIFQEYAKSNVTELAETCQVGLGKLDWLRSRTGSDSSSDVDVAKTFFPDTIDPAPGLDVSKNATDQELHKQLMNPEEPLFVRYRALFGIRDRILSAQLQSPSDEKHVHSLAKLLADGLEAPGSALLRHEVAFLLGQLTISSTVPALNKSLSQITEHPMVRHEAAEALGAIIGHLEALHSSSEHAKDINTARNTLERFLSDKEPLVRESCVLALDIADYVSSNDQFQYAAVPN